MQQEKTAINWEKFSVKIFSLVQPTTKIKLAKKFWQWKFTVRRLFWIICCWLGSLLVLTRDVNSKLLQAKQLSSRSQTIVVNMSTNASDRLANKAVEKAIMHKSLGKKWSGLFMVPSVAASSLVLFHATRSFELLRMMLPCTHVGNFCVKKFSLPVSFYEIIFTWKFITRKFATQIFSCISLRMKLASVS